MSKLQIVKLKGNSRQRGLQHGSQLKTAIHRALDFYYSFFRKYLGMDAQSVRQHAATFLQPTYRVSSELMAEYEGIAEGSGQTLEDIVALSARYEITFEAVPLGECSNLFVGCKQSRNGHALLGQNWDWRPEVMNFRAVFIARCDDLPDHVCVTECGQPGKYGFNAYGLGLTAAGLRCREKASIGENLFVVLGRKFLAQENLVDACKVIDQFAPRATVNFLLADAEGHAVDFESTPEGLSRLDLNPNQVYWHTNHCLQANEPCTFKNSLVRGRRWTELIQSPGPITYQMVQAWLADRHSEENSICQLPHPSMSGSLTRLQTLCSIVMDLNDRTMWISDGPSCEHPYQEVGLH